MSIEDFFRDEWAGIAPAWRRWGRKLEEQSAAATAWLLELAGVCPGMAVLDLASGTGDPALALGRRVGPRGSVMATDLVPGALEMTGRAAVAAGLANVTTRVASMEQLPFADASFDAVTCRLGVMFCGGPDRALAEAHRVLRPGGRAAFVVWGSPAQPLFEATLGHLGRAFTSREGAGDRQPDDQRPAPGPFRYAVPATLSRLLLAADFMGVSARERTVPWPFAGTGAELWRMFVDLGGPALRRQLDTMAGPVRRDLDGAVAAALDAHATCDRATIDTGARLVGAVGRR